MALCWQQICDRLAPQGNGVVLAALFECDSSNRFDFLPDSDAGRRVAVLLKAGQALGAADQEALPAFADQVAQWALMNLRSLPIGMRIDQ